MTAWRVLLPGWLCSVSGKVRGWLCSVPGRVCSPSCSAAWRLAEVLRLGGVCLPRCDKGQIPGVCLSPMPKPGLGRDLLYRAVNVVSLALA